jgi:hypothetical protein
LKAGQPAPFSIYIMLGTATGIARLWKMNCAPGSGDKPDRLHAPEIPATGQAVSGGARQGAKPD